MAGTKWIGDPGGGEVKPHIFKVYNFWWCIDTHCVVYILRGKEFVVVDLPHSIILKEAKAQGFARQTVIAQRKAA